MSVTRKLLLAASGIVAAVVLGGAVGAYVLAHASAQGSRENADSALAGGEDAAIATQVMAVHPRNDSSLFVTVTQLLSVEPFFVADLRAQVAGQVRDVQKDIGSPVYKGEVLVDIKTPDIEAELAEKEALVAQRMQDLIVAQKQADNARATVEVYKKIIEQRRAEYNMALAERNYRKIRYERYVALGQKDSVQQTLIDEEQKGYLAAEYAAESADVKIHEAEAELKEKESILATAEADIEQKKSLIEVARKSRDRARAMVDYTQIAAPFDGVVVKRNVDVGTFVQNASTGHSEPLLTVARSDIVTLTMKVPDNAAPYVTCDTEAVIQLDELPGVVIRSVDSKS
jgi:multidrug resistance efflux pump